MAVRQSDAVVATRTQEVFELILDGETFPEVLQHSSDQEWGISERMVRYYYHKALKLFTLRQAEERETMIARQLAICKLKIEQALRQGNDGALLQFMKHEAAIGGLEPKDDSAMMLRKELDALRELYERRLKMLTSQDVEQLEAS